MNRESAELERRTKEFVLRIIRFVGALSKERTTQVLGTQLLKAGTSIGANYREANRAESRDDFVHKIGIVEKEAAETQYWLDLFEEARIGNEEERKWLFREAIELLAIHPNRKDCQSAPAGVMLGFHARQS